MSDTAVRFFTACRTGDLETVKKMCENAKVEDIDIILRGYEIALQRSDDLVRYMLLDSPHRSFLRTELNTRVGDVCEEGDLERAQYYASLMQLCDQVYEPSMNTYILCCERGHLDIIRWLHSTTRCGDDKWKGGSRLGLRAAACVDVLPVVQWLLANVAFEQDTIDTVFRYAASNGSSRVVSFLLQHGVSEEAILVAYDAPVREDEDSEDDSYTVTLSVKDAIALYMAGKKSKKASLH